MGTLCPVGAGVLVRKRGDGSLKSRRPKGRHSGLAIATPSCVPPWTHKRIGAGQGHSTAGTRAWGRRDREGGRAAQSRQGAGRFTAGGVAQGRAAQRAPQRGNRRKGGTSLGAQPCYLACSVGRGSSRAPAEFPCLCNVNRFAAAIVLGYTHAAPIFRFHGRVGTPRTLIRPQLAATSQSHLVVRQCLLEHCMPHRTVDLWTSLVG